jgi:lipopolysaccharide transport protein LptA
VETPLKWSKTSPFQSFLLIGLFFFFAAHILLLSPSSLEEDFTGMRVIHPKDLLGFLRNESETLARERYLKDQAPTYSSRDGVLYSTENGKPKLKLISKKTNLYQAQQTAHIREAQVILEDGTRIQSKEALYDLARSKVTFLGAVECTFTSGAILHSELAYLELKPSLHLSIPIEEAVRGQKTNLSSPVFFESMGLDYSDQDQTLHLLSQVQVKITGGRPTQIISDRATFSHLNDLLYFTMDEARIIEKQFVEVTEPTLLLKSRKLQVKLESGRQIEEIIALQDVFFEDLQKSEGKTQGTGGKGVYLVRKNEITLSDFPQLYQDRDTVTGDSITYHRNTEMVEVIQSNAIYNKSPSQSR